MGSRPLRIITPPAGFLAVGLLFAGIVKCAADEPSPVEQQARLLLREALNARESVQTGRVKLSGHYTVRSLRDNPSWDGPVTGYYVFDRVANVYRYEGEVPCAVHINEPGDTSIAPSDLPAPVHRTKFGFCRAKDYFAYWNQTGTRFISDVDLLPLSREAEVRRSHTCGVRPLDVMAFGMLIWISLEKGTETARAYDIMLSRPVSSMTADEATTTIVAQWNNTVCSVVLDRQLAAPLRLENGPAHDPDQFQSTAEWRQISDVAVPVTYSATLTMPDVVVQSLELDLEWLTVNEDIPDTEFEYTAFRGIIPNRHDVMDLRTDPPKLLGRWMADGVVKPPAWKNPPPRQTLAPAQGKSSLWITLLIANGLFLFVLIAIWFAKRRTQATPPSP